MSAGALLHIIFIQEQGWKNSLYPANVSLMAEGRILVEHMALYHLCSIGQSKSHDQGKYQSGRKWVGLTEKGKRKGKGLEYVILLQGRVGRSWKKQYNLPRYSLPKYIKNLSYVASFLCEKIRHLKNTF